MKSADPHPWIRLRKPPERFVRMKLKACRNEGNETELEGRKGFRYLMIERDGKEIWLSQRTRFLPVMERDGVKPCCAKMRRAWGRFVDLGKDGGRGRQPVMFAKEVSQNQITQKKRTLEIQFCPFCGKWFQFVGLAAGQERPHARVAGAGA